MSQISLDDMLQALNHLSFQELDILNKQLVHVARAKRRETQVQRAAAVANKFQFGDVVRFVKSGRGAGAGVNYMIFKNTNRAGIAMKGPACDENGKVISAAITWTVPMAEPSATVHMRAGKPMNG